MMLCLRSESGVLCAEALTSSVLLFVCCC